MKFTIALLQIAPTQGNQDKNLEKGIRYCREAKMRGADLVVFPELWNIGFAACPIDTTGMRAWKASAIDQKDQFFQEFVALARELKLNIAITYLARHVPKPQNSVSIISGLGEVVLDYSKQFICDFGKEEFLKPHPNRDDIGCDFNCDPGDSFEVCTLVGRGGEVRVGAMICADREFPEAATELMLNGAEVIVVPIPANGTRSGAHYSKRGHSRICSRSQWRTIRLRWPTDTRRHARVWLGKTVFQLRRLLWRLARTRGLY